LRQQGNAKNDWIIALTDGEDNCSGNCNVNTITEQLRTADVGLVVIGVGSDVQTEVIHLKFIENNS
jgi:hypothetical protein